MLTLQLQAIQPATMQCASISSNGDATITWVGTTDVTDFVSYQLYFSTSISGTYSLIATINNASTTSFLHAGVGADVNNCHYFIKTNGSSSTGFSDTLSTIQLIVSNINDGNATLNWNAPMSPLPVLNSWYRIYREYPVGTWNLVDSTQANTFTENYSICDVQVSYKIEINGNGCINQSAIDVAHIRDLTPPAIPHLDSVSIQTPGGQITLGWDGVVEPDTKGYIIYAQQGGVWTPIDTVYGITNTMYQYTDASSATTALNYRIASIDSCDNASPLTPDQHSLVLSFATNNCLRSVDLSWNAYDHLPSGVLKYEIYKSENGGNFLKIGETTTETNFTSTGLIDLNNYQFFIRALANNGITASSTSISFEFHQTEVPNLVYFRYATVNASQTIDLAIYVDTNATTSGLVIYKKYPHTTYLPLTTLSHQTDGHYSFTDNDVSTSLETYHYFARVIDICGNEIMNSDTVHNILLTGSNIGNYTNLIQWISYPGFLAPIDNYSIYRSIEDASISDSIGFVTSNITQFQEDVTPLRYQGAFFNYLIEAQESNGNILGFKDKSRSNSIRIGQNSQTFIPNAFAPGGENKIFKPVNIFINPTEYLFVIYARNGSLIFETNDPNKGWDGIYEGELSPFGVYIYHLYYKNTDGSRFEKEGFVTLVR